jgi:hypothetical protein
MDYRTPRKGSDATMKLLRKGWDWLTVLAAAIDYDHADARISGLERDVRRLKDELGRIRMSAEPVAGGFEPSAPVRKA